MTWRALWDCEKVSPLFTVPSCVVFGEKVVLGTVQSAPIPGRIYSGQLSERNSSREKARKLLTVNDAEFGLHLNGPRSFWATEGSSSSGISPYKEGFENGATIFPRGFWFVHAPVTPLGISPKTPHVETDPRATEEAKVAYKSLRLSGNIEAEFLFASFLSADILPFAPVDYRLCVLPLRPSGGAERWSRTVEPNGGADRWSRTVEPNGGA